jgi:carboxyl-terminal processing protease
VERNISSPSLQEKFMFTQPAYNVLDKTRKISYSVHMNNSAKTILLAGIVALVTSFIGVQIFSGEMGERQDLLTTVLDKGEIRVGYLVYPPSIIKDPNTGELSGIFYEAIEEVGSNLNLEINWIEEVTVGTMLEGLRVGRYDIVGSGIWPNAARARHADFSIPLYYSAIGVYVRSGDDRFSDDQELYAFLNDFPTEREVFDALLFSQDNFSFFIDDYEEFAQSQQGISKSFGFQFGLIQPDANSSNIFGYVQYVFDSIAEDAGLERGDIFTRVDGTRLTVNNFRDLLSRNSITLTMAEVESTSPFSISETNETVEIEAQNLQENPILVSKVFENGSTKIGYLSYNAFRFNFHGELNDAFGEFQAEGIDELVLDLRYNGGGAVITCTLLASMISGLEETNIFASLIFNEKQESNNSHFSFRDDVPIYNENREVERVDQMNRLSLNRVYILTSSRTASASETLVNGLAPFMDVILIGQQTVGKDDGSITVYDSPPGYNSRSNANPGHMRAMQPIVFKIFNSNDEDYPNGFFPEVQVREIDYLDDLPPLGDANEPLLAAALEMITGEPALARMRTARLIHGEMVFESRDLLPFDREMYLLSGDLEGSYIEF